MAFILNSVIFALFLCASATAMSVGIHRAVRCCYRPTTALRSNRTVRLDWLRQVVQSFSIFHGVHTLGFRILSAHYLNSRLRRACNLLPCH
ncbi:hypothetical protein BT96DRAFT_980284 [Gymnopus androsaceus JB14]|uniref:Secreted protein n=1 Tax=Gymnopus androsaceus JB14 TaxID=1447944 RepID=A0A6A4GXG0_9AGAR|nr:hypothetical protein BT96DRAFT_980284 [Gymnopus androsaceus JB14]